MFDSIFKSVEQLFAQAVTWGRLILIIFLFFFSMATLIWYESYTSHFKLNKFEKQIYLLEKLETLSGKINKTSNPKITNIFKTITKDFNSSVNPQISNSNQFFYTHNTLIKAFTASLPWVLLCLLFSTSKTKTDNMSSILGVLIFGIPCIIIGVFLPNFKYLWINYLLYPFGLFFLIFLIVTLYTKLKTKKP